ncbi:hypothetical protein ACJX0J_036992 [Zea mays]
MIVNFEVEKVKREIFSDEKTLLFQLGLGATTLLNLFSSTASATAVVALVLDLNLAPNGQNLKIPILLLCVYLMDPQPLFSPSALQEDVWEFVINVKVQLRYYEIFLNMFA